RNARIDVDRRGDGVLATAQRREDVVLGSDILVALAIAQVFRCDDRPRWKSKQRYVASPGVVAVVRPSSGLPLPNDCADNGGARHDGFPAPHVNTHCILPHANTTQLERAMRHPASFDPVLFERAVFLSEAVVEANTNRVELMRDAIDEDDHAR